MPSATMLVMSDQPSASPRQTSVLDVAVVGAGIVGLAHAWSAAARGHRVTLFERSKRASGASVRNFGMIWPIGQPPGELHETALLSRQRWLSVREEAGVWVEPCGSLHVAHRPDEWAVVEEFAELAADLGYECSLFTPAQVQARCPAVQQEGLHGGLFSPTELAVNPRRAIHMLPVWLAEKYGVRLAFDANVTAVRPGKNSSAKPTVYTADGTARPVDRVIVCGGVDASLLFPQEIAESGLLTCKLQMLRTAAQPEGWRMGTLLASGLTLRHYRSFEVCPSLPALKARIRQQTPELDRYGIHVMAAQTDSGEVVLGDSHEYGDDVEPFDKTSIDELILRELRRIVNFPVWSIAERWHGLYAKHPKLPVVELEPHPEVHICTGAGGAGMTLAFGLAEAAWQRWTRER